VESHREGNAGGEENWRTLGGCRLGLQSAKQPARKNKYNTENAAEAIKKKIRRGVFMLAAY
jgi:hypothetical protein